MKLKPLFTALRLALGAGLLGASFYVQASNLDIGVNRNLLAATDTMEVSVAVDWRGEAPVPVDVYISVQTPEGYVFYLQTLNNITYAVTPILRNWRVADVPRLQVLRLPLNTGLPEGKYKWYFILARAGTDPAQAANWVAYNSAEFIFDRDGLVPPPVAADIDSSFAAMLGLFPGTPSGSATPETPVEPTPPAETPTVMPPAESALPTGSPGTLTAGDVDDHLNFNAFLGYLDRSRAAHTELPPIDLSGRFSLRLQDSDGKPLSHARVKIGTALETYAASDGSLQLFPRVDNLGDSVQVQIALPDSDFSDSSQIYSTTLSLSGGQQVGDSQTLTVPGMSGALPTQLDLMLVMDTTGSMSDELNYLTTELREITGTLSGQFPGTHIRFGLVAYRDIGDTYVVREYPFTDSIDDMQATLTAQVADAGGDYPEAMEQAVQKALQADWRGGNTARLTFLIADAPPHDENLSAMLEQAKSARTQGIRLYGVAGSGVMQTAEYVMRVSSALTQARYLFLTDDSGVGLAHAEPSVSCYQVTHLNRLIARVIASELAGQRVEANPGDVLRTLGSYTDGVCGG